MNSIKPSHHDPEAGDDQEEITTFERVRKQTGKAATPKDDRRQRSKEWGKRINKFHKERRRYEGPGKP